MKYKNKTLTIFLLLLSMFLYGEDDTNNAYIFDSISLEDGLSNSSVSSIQQDSKGFLWFGTQSGLNRYDGYEFITFNHDTFNKNSLPHGLVQSLFIDDEDIIWIGTYNGISRFDSSSSSFTNYEFIENDETSISNNVVTSIVKDRYGQIWVGTLGGLNRLDPDTGLFKRYLHDDNSNSILNDTVRSILIDSQDRIWIGNLAGIDLYNEKTDNFTHYTYIENIENGLPSPYVMKLLEYNKETILVGTWGGGLTLFNITTETYQNYSLEDNRVYTMEQDEEGHIWLGTWGGGLFIFNPSDHSIKAISTDENLNSSITSNTIYSLFKDTSGIMWVGTNGAGINKHNSEKKDFTFLAYDENSENSINSGKIETLLEDRQGNIWIGVYNGGLNHYNRETAVVTHYKHNENDENTISNDIVNNLFEDSNGNIWVSTNFGLNIYLPESDSFKQVYMQKEDQILKDVAYTVMYEDSIGNIWIGSHNHGLFQYNLENGENLYYEYKKDDINTLSDNLVYSIIERDNGELWIGTNKGLNLLDREKGSFKRYLLDRTNPEGLNNNTIKVLLEDKDYHLWVGTGGGGINLYYDETDSFSHITTREGLSNNSIMSLVEDEEGQIWAGTKYGLSIINKNTKDVNIMNQEDGLFTMEFTSGALKGSNNIIYLGSNNIINKFEMNTAERKESELITYLNSIEISGLDYIDHLSSPPYADIVLEYRDSNNMAFEYVALNYLNPHTTQYAHKLEGFDDDWILDKSRRFAFYTNIPPGEYTFKVKAAQANRDWSEKIFEQNIRIKPPLWSTWWAKVLYSLFILGIVYLLISLRTNFLRKDALNRLKESERNLSITLNSIGDAVIATDHLGRITKMNPIAETLTGWNFSEAEGSPLIEIFHIKKLQSGKFKEDKGNLGLESHNILISRDGSEIQISDSSAPIQNEEGHVLGTVLVFRDVSQQYKYEERLRHSQKMEVVGQLAGGMAHDFNNVLSGILSASELLRLPQNELNEKSLKYVDLINQASVRASDLISKLLAFSRKGKIVTKTLNIHQILNDTVDILVGTIDKKITISVIKEASNPNFIGDHSAVENVIMNLGINASHSMPNGGVIQLKTKNKSLDQNYCDSSSFEINPGEFLQIEIKDTGCGIPEENLQKIFDPFFTTNELGHGTGLGLSAVYGTIQDHHGVVEVFSELGSGTTFIILLPCSQQLNNQVNEISSTVSGSGTILFVDDEEMNRTLSKEILESLGYRVLLAEDGLESIDVFTNKYSEIDIVLMDLIMPKMNGSEAFHKMKEIDPNCKVILTSGYTRDENINELIKDGLIGFINKPYSISEISQLLDDAQKKS